METYVAQIRNLRKGGQERDEGGVECNAEYIESEVGTSGFF